MHRLPTAVAVAVAAALLGACGTGPRPALGADAPPTTGPPPTTTAPAGDAGRFCAAAQRLGAIEEALTEAGGDAAVAEVSLSPVLAPLLDELEHTAPPELTDAFVSWRGRNAAALEELRSTGISTTQEAELTAGLEARLDGVLAGTPGTGLVEPDVVATGYGVDRAALDAAAGRFSARTAPYAGFARRFDEAVRLDQWTLRALEATFPCVARLAGASA
jgi:hypothetical protein